MIDYILFLYSVSRPVYFCQVGMIFYLIIVILRISLFLIMLKMENQLVSKLNSCLYPNSASKSRDTCFVKHTPYMHLKHMNECTHSPKNTTLKSHKQNVTAAGKRKEKIQKLYSIWQKGIGATFPSSLTLIVEGFARPFRLS